MSNFKCEKCGKDIIDSQTGYINGCEHYPLPELPSDIEEGKG